MLRGEQGGSRAVSPSDVGITAGGMVADAAAASATHKELAAGAAARLGLSGNTGADDSCYTDSGMDGQYPMLMNTECGMRVYYFSV